MPCTEELSSAVTTGLLLAAIVGFMQLAVFSLFAGPILGGMGISRHSEMTPTAMAYMKARAFAAPAATLWVVANGIFRDTERMVVVHLAWTASPFREIYSYDLSLFYAHATVDRLW